MILAAQQRRIGGSSVTTIHAAQALLPEGWRADVRLGLRGGMFAAVDADAPAQPGDERHAIALPALPNLHSHAFQRGMAGLAETRGASADSFWSWRDVMYRFALAVTPDQVEALAGQLYVEMLESGFCRVGEFHYLHHDGDGRPYAAIAEMAARIAAAAQDAGIGLTLLPVFYAHAGFGGAPPVAGQRRFVSDLDGYARLLEGAAAALKPLAGAVLGVAPHSLRAVAPGELAALAALLPLAPLHIHVAEQVGEVEDCLAWSGARPVQWLLDQAPVDARWSLVHATHITRAEVAGVAARGAVVGLCPITEANLGDGTFPAVDFIGAGGRFGIGSDSNVQVDAAAELRQLEYSQRLAHLARNVLARNVLAPDGAARSRSTGRALLEGACEGGGAALGVPARGLAAGAPADLVTLDANHPALAERPGDAAIDAWIFVAGKAAVDCVWVGGRKLVEAGRHHRREAVARRFRSAMRELRTI